MKLCFLQGKVYNYPQKNKTKNGAEIYTFSIGINNSYKKDNKWVNMPQTFVSFVVFDKNLFNIIESIKVKEDTLNIIAKFDNIEEVRENKRYVKTIFTPLKIYKNNKDFFGDVINLFRKNYDSYNIGEEIYNPAKIDKEEDSDLPF